MNDATDNDSAEKYQHTPVLAAEVMEHLAPQPGDTVLDATVGLGGHSVLLAKAIGASGWLIGLDRDTSALERARAALATAPCRVDLVHCRFGDMRRALHDLKVRHVDRLLLDFGVSSPQLDDPGRGFSFRNDGPLDMRMDQSTGQTAEDLINLWSEEELAKIFQELGEERFSHRFAKTIAAARRQKPIKTTGELAALLARAAPSRGKIHPATRVFQALRMIVNDEIGEIRRGLISAVRVVRPGGRIAVITFHSGEDRLAKSAFRAWQERGVAEPCHKKAIACGRVEMLENRRARSAKLRVTEILGDRGRGELAD